MIGSKRKPPAERPTANYILHDPVNPTIRSISSNTFRTSPTLCESNAIVIDFGTSRLRAGYSTQSLPYLEFPPLVARTRDVDTGCKGYLIGNDALISSARSTARMAYDTCGIPNNPSIMERLLDGTLYNLGLYEEDYINQKFILTESPCNPNLARNLIMEILYEGYNTKSICFGIDALFSYYYNCTEQTSSNKNSLIVSCGNKSTHVLPYINNSLHTSGIKRINLGGSDMTSQLQRRLQLLNSEHSSLLTQPRIETMKESLCYISPEYDTDLKHLKQSVDYYNQINNTIRIPLIDNENKNNLTPEEQERQKQARIDNGKRLSEMMREKRKQNLNNHDENKSESIEAIEKQFNENDIQDLRTALKNWYELERINQIKSVDEDKYYQSLILLKYDSMDTFNRELEKLLDELNKQREKLTTDEAKLKTIEAIWWKKMHEDEILSISDTELSPTELKKKRHIRALRGAAEARERIKKQKEKEITERERIENELLEMKKNRPSEYLNKLKIEREELAKKIKKRQASREAGSNRRSQAARERMRLLAQHAGNKGSVEESNEDNKRNSRSGRSRNNNSNNRKNSNKNKDNDNDDNFGWNDEDWDVYRNMKVRGGESDSDDQSGEEKERLEKVREEILDLAPEDDDPTISRPEGVALLYEDNPYHDEISVCVDRIRTGEILFQPSLAGIEQCGLAEAMALTMSSHRSNIVDEVFLTGGVSQMNGLKERVSVELRKMMPTELGNKVISNVKVAKNGSLDAWKGAAKFAQYGGRDFDQSCITKSDYEEMGVGYIREHAYGNKFFATPKLSAAELELKKKLQKQSSKRGRLSNRHTLV